MKKWVYAGEQVCKSCKVRNACLNHDKNGHCSTWGIPKTPKAKKKVNNV